MARIAALVLLLLMPAIAAGQKCSTHTRKAWPPSHWLSSNMCEADYQAWRQAHPSHPFWRDKWFWVGVAAIGAEVTADMHSSAYIQPRYIETGFVEHIGGYHPSDRVFALWGGAAFSTYFTLHVISYHYSYRDPSEAWRVYGRLQIPAIAGAIHIPAALRNYELGRQPCTQFPQCAGYPFQP